MYKAESHTCEYADPSQDNNTSLAEQAAQEEHGQGFWQAVRVEKAACFWSVAISTCIIMEGYGEI